VLTVTSGGSANVVAVIDFSGHYVTWNFHLTSGSSGTVEIFDPPVGVQQTTFGSHQTLGYIEKNCRNRHRRYLGRQDRNLPTRSVAMPARCPRSRSKWSNRS
jgi:hypothetical protein